MPSKIKMKKLTRAEFDKLTEKLHTYFKNVKPMDLGNGVSFLGSLADALGKEDAEAYQQYQIEEAYQQHGIRPKTA